LQEVFLRTGLMEYGSICGHGAYIGPEFTSDYMRHLPTLVREQCGRVQSNQALARTGADFETTRLHPPRRAPTRTRSPASMLSTPSPAARQRHSCRLAILEKFVHRLVRVRQTWNAAHHAFDAPRSR
jgi:hypothetical protein